MSYNFKTCTENDKEWALELDYECYFDTVKKQFGSNDKQVQVQFFNSKWKPEDFKLIIFKDKKIGLISTIEEPDNLIISEILIDKPFQNQGHGTKILNKIINSSPNLNKKLRVLKQNKALNLYKRIGFEIINEDATYFNMIFKKSII